MQNVAILVTWHTTSEINHFHSIACIIGFWMNMWYKRSNARGDIQTRRTLGKLWCWETNHCGVNVKLVEIAHNDYCDKIWSKETIVYSCSSLLFARGELYSTQTIIHEISLGSRWGLSLTHKHSWLGQPRFGSVTKGIEDLTNAQTPIILN